MRDYTHHTDWRERPKWQRALINMKWHYIKLDRKMHGRLSFVLMMIGLFAGITLITRNPGVQEDAIAKCLLQFGGCIIPI